MITGVVLARNEAAHIVECLRSLRPHVAELLLIDMQSTDETVELARPHVERVLSHPLVPRFDAARNMALDQGHFDWFWFLDADERVPELTGQQVNRLVRQRGHECVAITIPFQTFFCGKWIQHCGWWPGYTMPRVLKRGHFRFAEQLHGGVQFHGPELRLPPDPQLAIKHYSYRSLEHYVEKFNRYTSAEAVSLQEAGRIFSWEDGLREMMRDLWAYYEKHEGYKDGQHGWILSWLAGQYRWFSQAKLLDLEAASDEASVPANLDEVISLLQHELARLRSAEPVLPLGIVWRSPIFDPSGYADDSRVFLRSLAESGRPLAAEQIRWSDRECELPKSEAVLLRALTRARRPPSYATVTSCIPTLCQPDTSASLNILRTTFETDRIPAHWLARLEGFDEIWVFTEHDRVAFRRSGVAPEKLRVLPGFVDTVLFQRRGRSMTLPDVLQQRFVFLSVFDWQWRKGWDVLLRAYCMEFSVDDGVGLLLKISTAHGHTLELIRQQAGAAIESISQSLAARPDIVFLPEMLSCQDMAALYRSADAFVLASRGEGWGRPYMEAMACGLPTIGTAGSGNADFMTADNSFLVRADLVDVPRQAICEIPVYDGHRWLEPDQDHLRQRMREVAEDVPRRTKISQAAARDIRRDYCVQKAGPAVEQLLCHAEQRFAPPPAPAVTQQQLRVTLQGEIFAGHSFANVNEKLAHHLARHPDIALSIDRVENNPSQEHLSPDAWRLKPFIFRPLGAESQATIRHAFPPDWAAPPHGFWIHIQPWEYGHLPREWVPPLRDLVDEIWAPSRYVKQVYERSGIPADKVHVIPWGVEHQVFHPDVPPLFLPCRGSFVFLFVGGTIARKGFDLLLEAYLEEFTPEEDVSLVVKDMGTATFYRYGNLREQVVKAIAAPDHPDIVYLEQQLTEGQLASLYRACDCLVAPYRGEGFGLPILEAMACGLPPMIPRGGAADDFMIDEAGFFVPAEEIECDHEWRLCGPATELSIELNELRAHMRLAFEARQQTHSKGRLAAEAARQYSWQRTTDLMIERLRWLVQGSQRPRHQRKACVHAQPASLTVCTLTQNHEATVGDSLAPIRPFASEIILLDLGSQDRTTAIASEYGCRIYHGRLADSMSQLRNAILRKATSDWILVLDGDETLDDQSVAQMHNVLANGPSQTIGVELQLVPRGQSRGTREVRLFRNCSDIIFESRACEDVTASLGRRQGQLLASEIQITRHAYQGGRPSQFRQSQTVLALLHRDLQQGEDRAKLKLGATHFQLGNYFHAECYLNDGLEASSSRPDVIQTSAAMLIESHLRKGDPERAQEVARRVEENCPGLSLRPPPADGLMHVGSALRLYLGAGNKRLPGYVHVDIQAQDGIDIACDLSRIPWPWDDGSVDLIVAEDLVEHLEIDLVRFCDEAWRVLKPHGELFVRTPHHQGDSSWIDPTHRWHLNEQAFQYLDPDSHWGRLYPQYTQFKWRLLSLGIRGPQNIHALLMPRK